MDLEDRRMIEPRLTRDDARALGLAALTALLTTVVAGAVQWGFEEAKTRLAKRREEKERAPFVTLD